MIQMMVSFDFTFHLNYYQPLIAIFNPIDIATTTGDFEGFPRLQTPVSREDPQLPPPPPPPPPLPLPPKDQPMADLGRDTTIDEELGNYFDPKDNNVENDDHKISQLRRLLAKNFQPPSMNMVSSNSAFKPAIKPEPNTWTSYPESSQEAEGSAPASSLSSRRRVSFNHPLIVEDVQENNGSEMMPESGQINPNVTVTNNSNAIGTTTPGAAVSQIAAAIATTAGNGLIAGQSPGTRKRHFSFQPISPRQASLPQSPSASPFISPRSTPVPMMRSRHSSGSALPLHLLPSGGSVVLGPGGQKFNSSSSDISRAATFGSASESSTPFISPHGTPIPFNRSRHNSAQGRLCRSRHSSGVAPYRYNMTFSPMALNNLNNPYSPQPATPVGTTCPDEVFVTTYVTGDTMGNGVIGQAIPGGQTMVLNPNDDPRSRHSSAGSCDMNNVRSAPMSPHCGVKDVMMDPNSVANNGVLGQRLSGDEFGQPELKRQRHASAGAMNYQGTDPNEWLTAKPIPVTLDQQQAPPNLRSQPLSQIISTSARAASTAVSQQSVPDFSLTENSSNPNLGQDMDFMSAAGVQEPSPPESSIAGLGGGGGVGNHNSNSSDGDRKDGGPPGAETQDDLELTLNALKDCDNDFSKFFQDAESGGK